MNFSFYHIFYDLAKITFFFYFSYPQTAQITRTEHRPIYPLHTPTNYSKTMEKKNVYFFFFCKMKKDCIQKSKKKVCLNYFIY